MYKRGETREATVVVGGVDGFFLSATLRVTSAY